MGVVKQKQKLFHRVDAYPFTHHLPPAPTEAELREMTDPNNPSNPLSKIIGQPEAKKRLGRAARQALAKYNHACNELAFLFTGPKGVGKTTMARAFAKLLKIPFIEISPSAIKTPHDLWTEIGTQLEKQGLPLVLNDDGMYLIPPCVLFIDECHDLKNKQKVVTALLKAVAINDRTLLTEEGVVASTRYVCWLMATTDRGDLFDALDDRFTEIPLSMYTKDQVAEIVRLNYGPGNANDGLPEMPVEACQLAAHYRSRQPRRALEFAREVRMAKHSGITWEEAAAEVAQDCGIDKFGMDRRLVQILTLLGQKPVSQERLPTMIGCKDGELKKFHLPFLQTETPDQPAFITVSSSGYVLTKAGRLELVKRGIPCTSRTE